MSMTPPAHPDPERLAALAGADADALSDRELGAHVAACAACGQQVRDMTALRSALAELPDLVPSRPLRLVPLVAEPAAAGGWRVAFRRAFAPVAVAGMVLLLIGGVGATGALGPADAGALFENFQIAAPVGMEAATGPFDESATDSAVAPDLGGAAASEALRVALGTPLPTESTAELLGGSDTGRGGDLAAVEDRLGWIAAALAGIGLLALALVLRRSAAPAKRELPGR